MAAVRPVLAAGGYHSCVVTSSGNIRCAGDNLHGQRNTPLPDEGHKYTSVAAGAFHTCGLQDDGALKCWGDDAFGQSTVPQQMGEDLVFASVSAGPWHTCALTEPEPDAAGGLLKCWGNDYHGQLRASKLRPDDPFSLVSAGGYTNFRPQHWDGRRYRSHHASRTCVLDPEGSVACEGNEMGNHTFERVYDPVTDEFVETGRVGPHGPLRLSDDTLYYTAVSSGGGHACALVTDGTMDCWGQNYDGQLGPPFGAGPDNPGNNGRPVADPGWRWTEVAAGGRHTCATMEHTSTGRTRLRCWGDTEFFDTDGHGGHPTDADAGTDPRNPVAGTSHTCWLHGPPNDTKVSCRGDDAFNAARWNNRTISSFDPNAPADLNPGDQFRLLFVTSAVRDATSDDISDYDKWVQGLAANGHTAIRPFSSDFRVVATTEATASAFGHTDTAYTNACAQCYPIYWFNGDKVADHYRDFWDGTWDSPNRPTDEFGRAVTEQDLEVFTGTDRQGIWLDEDENSALGDDNVGIGYLNHANNIPYYANGAVLANTEERRFYAISPLLTVGADGQIHKAD